MSDANPKILITEAQYAPHVAEVAAQFPDLTLLCVDENSDARGLAGPDIAGLITQAAPVNDELLDALPGLRVVLKNGRNYQNVDAEAVRARGIALGCVPRKGPNCVAELAMTMILALSKDLLISHTAVADGAYRLRGMQPELTAERKFAFHWMRNMRVHEVVDKTLGIIGMGEIGAELARRAGAMGMRVIYNKRTPLSAELEQRLEAQYRALPELISQSDYICIALPHTPETDKLIGADELASMKSTAYIVNIARGGIIDEDALIEALSTGAIAGAGLDVFTYEPLQASSPLCTLDNVILTPHIGGGTGTTRAAELGVAVAEVAAILGDKAPRIDLR
jgi:lactate dehydrogenase-like 2-hydroxyacid dehydrogenase